TYREGTVTRADKEGLHFKSASGTQYFLPWRKVRTIKALSEVPLTAVLRDAAATNVQGLLIRCTSNGITIKTTEGKRSLVRWSRVKEIQGGTVETAPAVPVPPPAPEAPVPPAPEAVLPPPVAVVPPPAPPPPPPPPAPEPIAAQAAEHWHHYVALEYLFPTS